jgi:hypothetical protein
VLVGKGAKVGHQASSRVENRFGPNTVMQG